MPSRVTASRCARACTSPTRVLAEAERHNDLARASRLRDELEFLTREVAVAYGLHGHARAASDPAEKLRKAVANRIKDGIERISGAHAAVGRHLARSIRTGILCVYSPESPTAWELHP